MPLPEQSRYTLGVKSSMEDPRAVSLERAVNRLPFFPEYERTIYTPGGTSTLSNTNAIDMNLTTDGLFYIDFEKYETWTDVKVRIAMSGYVTTPARIVNISAVLTDQSGVETTVDPIAKFAFNTASEHHSFYGEARVEDLIPGVYRLQFQWRVTGNSFVVNVDDAIFASVIECIPIPLVG